MRRTNIRPSRPALSVSPLEEVESAFLALASLPWPLTLPGSLLPEPEAGVLAVTRVRSRMAHPSCTAEARARVWREVLRRRQAHGEPWGTVAVGFAIPGLRRALARLPRLAEVEACELEQEVLTAVTIELTAMPVGADEAGLRLLRAGDRAAHRLLYAAQRRGARPPCRWTRTRSRGRFPSAGTRRCSRSWSGPWVLGFSGRRRPNSSRRLGWSAYHGAGGE